MERKVIGAFACLLVLVAVPAFGQDDCATAGTLSVANNYDGATTAVGNPCDDTNPTGPLGGSCVSGGGLNDLWFTFTAVSTATRIRSDVASSGTDSDYVVYAVDQGDICNSASWTEVGCGEDYPDLSSYLSDITVSTVPGDTYLVQFGCWGDLACGDYALTLGNPPPVPTLPEWGLLGLGVLLLGGGAVVFGRLRFVA